MPKYNELKHFNPHKISTNFLDKNNLMLGEATMGTT